MVGIHNQKGVGGGYMEYTIALDSKLNLEKFKLCRCTLSGFCSGLRERGNLYLIQINIRCLQAAVQYFRKNLSLYSGPYTKDEWLTVMNNNSNFIYPSPSHVRHCKLSYFGYAVH